MTARVRSQMQRETEMPEDAGQLRASRGTESVWAEQLAGSLTGGGTWPHLRHGRSICGGRSSTPGGCSWAAGETEGNQEEIIARAQCPGLGPMKRTDSGYICHHAPPPPPPPCWAHHAPRQSPRRPPSRERRPPERAGSWAVAAEEEEAASAAPWMR